MSSEFLCPSGVRAWMPSLRRALRRMAPVASAFAILAGLLVMPGCSGNHSTAGQPPSITTQPVNTSTVTGRMVSLTVAASGQQPLDYQWAKDGQPILGAVGPSLIIYSPTPANAGTYVVTVSNPLGTATSAPATLTVVPALSFSMPFGLAVDASGNMFVSDANAHTIWKVDATNHMSLLAGSPGLAGALDGVGSAARFNYPGGLALDPSGNLLVADTGNDTLRRIAPDGTVTTLAGAAGVQGSVDGPALQARFNGPVGVAVDGTGVVYISDSLNHTIRKLALDGTVSTLAGSAGIPGSLNATGSAARFNQPAGLALRTDGLLVVADYGNSTLRAVSSTGVVTTLAGLPTTTGFVDGPGSTARFYLPLGITMDSAGNAWLVDTYNHVVRKIASDGTVVTIAGVGGTPGNVDGTGTAAYFKRPSGIAVLPNGDLLVADTGNGLLRRVTTAGVATTLTVP